MASSPHDALDRDAAPAEDLRTIHQVVERARATLPAGAWEYARAGAGEEVTVRRNRSAWRRLAFAPSVLRDVSDVETSTRVLGVDLALPVMCSPVGSLAVFHPDGAAAAAAGAASMGTVAVVGILSSPDFTTVQSVSDGRNLFQIYASGDAAWMDAVVDRVTEAGARGLCITVDSPVRARRDRLLEGTFDWRLEQEGVPPNLEGLGRDRDHQMRLTWRDLERLRSRTDLPIAVKGIMGAADAARAVDVGMDAVYVSNHGGRELDHAPSTIEVLEEVVGAVDGRAEVVMDSGIRHGSDVCKALALGARAVLIGRLQCWGLAAGGAEGVAQVLRILRAEVADTMALLGVTRLDQLTRDHVRPTQPA